mmetsp:Transcript_7995/g.10987  ORF Transcript_7995/g.10987 Transcript_7995/m.10987 type:complete len:228 (+) Transcript_7995:69-752(+)
MAALFDDASISPITKLLERELKSCDLGGVDFVFLAGGFADSAYLRKRVKSCVKNISPEIKVCHPLRASMAILKGGAMMGSNPSAVVSRKARFTYAVSRVYAFDKSRGHDEGRSYFTSEGLKLIIILDILVKEGEDVTLGQEIIRNGSNPEPLTRLSDKIFRCTSTDVRYPDQKDAQLLGKLVVQFDRRYATNCAKVRFVYKFGGTSLSIKATDRETKNIFTHSVEFC